MNKSLVVVCHQIPKLRYGNIYYQWQEPSKVITASKPATLNSRLLCRDPVSEDWDEVCCCCCWNSVKLGSTNSYVTHYLHSWWDISHVTAFFRRSFCYCLGCKSHQKNGDKKIQTCCDFLPAKCSDSTTENHQLTLILPTWQATMSHVGQWDKRFQLLFILL